MATQCSRMGLGGIMGRKAVKPCGTVAALRRHYKRNEPVCEACAEARRQRTAEDYAKRSGRWAPSSGPDRRMIRNGLPEFRPYVYRGLGYDTLGD